MTSLAASPIGGARRWVRHAGPRATLGLLAALLSLPGAARAEQYAAKSLNFVQHIVVLLVGAESFDHLFGAFPGAAGLAAITPAELAQRDRDGNVLRYLPPVWQDTAGLGGAPVPDPRFPRLLPAAPFAIDDPKGAHLGLDVALPALVPRFHLHALQMNDGKLDGYAAWSTAGGLALGQRDGSSLALWRFARSFALADSFFTAAYGAAFLNRLWLACACAPRFPDAPPALRARLDDKGRALSAPDAPARAADGPPRLLAAGPVMPDGVVVEAMPPAFAPPGAPGAAAWPALPPQTMPTLGDQLSARSVTWAWYVDGWSAAERGAHNAFDASRQPYLYFAGYAPGSPARASHLKDGAEFFAALDYAALEEVVFYEPGTPRERRPGEGELRARDRHLADILRRLQASRQWSSSVVVIVPLTHGGWWDHVAPPVRDALGPGARVPLVLVSPFARRHLVDHTPYDHGSVVQLIARRHRLPALAGQRAAMGDLTAMLSIAGLASKAAPAKARANATRRQRDVAPRRHRGNDSKAKLYIFDDQ